MGTNMLCCITKEDQFFIHESNIQMTSDFPTSPINSNQLNNHKTIDLQSYLPFTKLLLISKHIKGFLSRLKFNTSYKKTLINHTNQILLLYNHFITKNDLVNEAKKNQIYINYTTEGWTEFYKENCFSNNHHNTITLYKTIHIKYNTDYPHIEQSESLFYNTKWLYKGQVNMNGELNGYGIKIYPDGSIEEGTWFNSIFEGWNRAIDRNGIIQIGKYTNGILNGKGIRVTVNNSIYKGDFVDGLRDGHGYETSNKSTYEGSYIKGEKGGKGSIIFPSGDLYKGDFLNNTFNGHGHYIWKKNNREYIGEYQDGKFHGQGLYKINDKESFKGYYINGVKEGKGELIYEDGRKYICTFVNGVPHGMGTFINKEGKKLKIEFDNGRLLKEKILSSKSVIHFH